MEYLQRAARGGRPPATNEMAGDRLGPLRALTRLLDDAIQIPGTRLRFGLDPILGLVPGAGDFAGAVASGYALVVGAQVGAPAPVMLRMALNILIDATVGVIPLLGDLFDFGWKSNRRNLRLLEQHLERPAATRRASALVVAGVLAAGLFAAAGAVWLAFMLLRAIAGALGL